MEERHSRQTFLGKRSEAQIRSCVVGIVGLGGGGSHIVQQLAHIGFLNFVIYDGDKVEESNLNRLIGANVSDPEQATPKIEVARRQVLNLQPKATVYAFQSRWQDNPMPLKDCDIIFGCVDGFSERRELETCARRYLIPYIDIGLDVHPGSPPNMTGQIILSLPGEPCLKCLDYLSDKNLAIEASKYGAAGIRPQVVWGNGVLASTAVGICVDLVTGWTHMSDKVTYLEYDGNLGTLRNHVRLEFHKNDACTHFLFQDVGDPIPKQL